MAATNRELLVEINAKMDGFKRGMSQAEKTTNKFASHMKAVGATIVAAFSVRAIARFASEVSKLSAEAEGVKVAFRRISSGGDLDSLRDSVAGTVSDLELMRNTVQANNLGVPIQNLGKFFEFASRRAQETGESVDYLVNSIVTGVGRKSPLILDNLGISATRLKSELGGVGLETASTFEVANAVAKIANEELTKMGKRVNTTKDEQERLNAEWDNAKVSMGNVVNMVKSALLPAFQGIAKWVGEASKSLSQIRDEAMDASIRKSIAEDRQEIKFLAKRYEEAGLRASDWSADAKKLGYNLKVTNYEQAAAVSLLGQYEQLLTTLNPESKQYESNIERVNSQIVALKRSLNLVNNELLNNGRASDESLTGIAALQVKLEELNKQYLSASTDQVRIKVKTQIQEIESQIDAIEQRIDAAINNLSRPTQLSDYQAAPMSYFDAIAAQEERDHQSFMLAAENERIRLAGALTQIEKESADSLMSTIEKQTEGVDNMISSFTNLASVLASIWADAIGDTEDYGEALRKTIKSIISALAAEGIAWIIKNSLQKDGEKLGALAVPVAAGAGVLAGAMFDKLVPKFADGGIVPGTSYTGDNVLARVNSGERILTPQQYSNLVSNKSKSGYERVEFEIKGTKLIGVIKNTNRYLEGVR